MKNLIVRTLTGMVFVAVLVGAIVYHPSTFGFLFAIITALSVREFCTVVNQREDVQINSLICTVSGVYLFLAFFGFCSNLTPSSVFIPYLLSIIYLLVSELYLKRPNPINNWAYTMMSQMYVALPFALLNILAFQSNTNSEYSISYIGIIPLSVFIFLWSSDSGAYCFGSMLGRRKLFPSISPNKSWEGSIGGGITALVVSVIIAQFSSALSLVEWMGLALTVVVFGTWGDLVESLLKRKLGIKDSGHILPGHGGMLDRFDSAMLAIPAVCIYLYTITLW
ncbi:MAG: phosphatidate cytidylyltransferase [Paraprevotella sp.]|nr:phosphatidate cytidylyltransferase [Paraprevotella sp.]